LASQETWWHLLVQRELLNSSGEEGQLRGRQHVNPGFKLSVFATAVCYKVEWIEMRLLFVGEGDGGRLFALGEEKNGVPIM